MSKNYFVRHTKNRSPNNFTQMYNTFCVGIFLIIAVKEGIILYLYKYCILFTVLNFRKHLLMDIVLLYRVHLVACDYFLSS